MAQNECAGEKERSAMKKLSIVPAIGLAGILAVGTAAAPGDMDVSGGTTVQNTSDFYSPLSPYGAWVNLHSYGRCWRPTDISIGWRPYCNGSWVWTDCGWYWDSTEPWSWACYHYGSWYLDSSYGWLWVPGTQWAPAWVAWRTGDGFIGWAPLPPRGFFFAHQPSDSAFVFVNDHDFDRPITLSLILPDNNMIIGKTRYINNIRAGTRNVGGTPRPAMINDGPGLATIEKATGRTFRPVAVSTEIRRTPMPSNFRNGGGPAEYNRDQRMFSPPAGHSSPRPIENNGAYIPHPSNPDTRVNRPEANPPAHGPGGQMDRNQPGAEKRQGVQPAPPAKEGDKEHQAAGNAPGDATAPAARGEAGHEGGDR